MNSAERATWFVATLMVAIYGDLLLDEMVEWLAGLAPIASA